MASLRQALLSFGWLVATSATVGARRSTGLASSPSSAFVAPTQFLRRASPTLSLAQRAGLTTMMASPNAKYTLVLVRHGESTWNEENRFTGWYDCDLSKKGLEEAHEAGKILKKLGYEFDLAWTSYQRRAIRTCWICLDELDQMWIPVKKSWRLNERHYGALQGLNKKETVAKHGVEQVNIWRRSYDIPPPPLDESSPYYPGNDPRYKAVPKSDLPLTESLKITEARFLKEWEASIKPDITAGKRVMIAAHGNSLRALVKHLDNISEEEICGLNIPTGVPLVYELDENIKPIPHPDRIGSLSGHYLGDQKAILERIQGVANQTGK